MMCRRPFEQYYVATGGNVHLCCPGWIDIPAGNVLADNPIAIWKGQVAHELRASIVDQSFKHCTSCPFLPSPSGCVWNGPGTYLNTDRIHTLTMAYDSTCNLSCPSCRTVVRGPDAQAVTVQEKLIESGIFHLVDRLCSSGSGDPFASPLYWDLLEKLPSSLYPSLRLIIQTNGILLNQKTWDRLGNNAKRINEVLVSVDAAHPATYETNRRGGHWTVLLGNLASIIDRQIPLQLNMVVQANNFLEMPAFVKLARALGAVRTYFSAIEQWGTYSNDDYLNRAVHLNQHPDHPLLLDTLKHPDLQDPQFVILARLPR